MNHISLFETSSNEKKKSFWQSGRLKCQQLFSTRHKKKAGKNELNRMTSDDSLSSFPSSSSSSSSSSTTIASSSNEWESNSTSSSESSSSYHNHPPENHPPAHVFRYGKEGYSIFYRKISNGNYVVRVRTADRKIIATYEVEGSMI